MLLQNLLLQQIRYEAFYFILLTLFINLHLLLIFIYSPLVLWMLKNSEAFFCY